MIKLPIYVVLTLFLSMLVSDHLIGQNAPFSLKKKGFDAQLNFALNFSQLHGDGDQGFNLGGIRAGSFIDYKLSSQKSIGLGLTYNQQGSHPTFSLSAAGNQDLVRLHYLSIPILYSLHSKIYDNNGNHTTLSLGASINRLFSVKTDHPIFKDFTEDFESFDISLRGGVKYYFSYHSAISLDYEQAIGDILKTTSANNLEGLRSFSFSIGLSYLL